ncbi:MAG: hypothetical protein M3Y21_12665 [Candidatus Eremiobacteraeota bacterium]|nr:hypothetical protein [Candidatus Eremiobacteraeota bacterium]
MIQSTVVRFAGSVALAALLLAGCGGHKTTTTTTMQVTSGPNDAMATTAPQGGPMMTNSMAAIPPDVNCGAVKPVWVNMKSKAYHEAGDPYYGKTRNGKYMCPSAAVSAGYHAAGSMHGSSKYSRHGKHRTHNGAMMNAASPAPAGEPTP